MGARRLRPGQSKVSGLTPNNVAALRTAADHRGWVGVTITPTTATWSCSAGHALALVLDAIAHPTTGQDTRSLHAVKRKLQKQVRPGQVVAPPPPDPPKAARTRKATECDHATNVGVGKGRVKCLECGLIYDQAQPKAITALAATPAAPKPQAPRQRATVGIRGRYLAVRHDTAQLVVDLQGALVIASCADDTTAKLIAAALNRKDTTT